jgi:hypothetical protein
VLCFSTIDAGVIEQLKSMQMQLQRVGRADQGKFKMVQHNHSAQQTVLKTNRYFESSMQLCNTLAHKFTEEQALAEQEFL